MRREETDGASRFRNRDEEVAAAARGEERPNVAEEEVQTSLF